MTWTAATDNGPAGLDGYAVVFNTTDISTCDETKDLEETATTVTSDPLPGGSYYFHICTVDNAGNWTSTVTVGPFPIVAGAAVGGVLELPGLAGTAGGSPASTLGGDDASSARYVLFGSVMAAAIAVAVGVWYTGRRWLGWAPASGHAATGRSAKPNHRKKSRAQKGSPWTRLLKTLLGALVLGLVVSVVMVSPPGKHLRGLALSDSSSPPEALTAAIVDQLSLTQPNPEFADTVTRTLERGGYTVDYYPGEEVTVSFYRTLPSRGYDLILLRVHSTARITGAGAGLADVSLFTSEPYSPGRYVEQMTGGLGAATYFDGGEEYFGLTADFIRSSIRGSFDGATIVMMGCEGLSNQAAAQAFLDKGADSFVAWTGLVSAAHTDAATESLLQDLLIEGSTLPDAVSQAMEEVGPDPVYGSELVLRLAD